MNYFIDCGANLGQGLLEFNAFLKMFNNPEWVIHSFECNPDIELKFEEVSNFNFYQKAIWVEDSSISFLLATRDNEYTAPLGLGQDSKPGELTRLGNHVGAEEIQNQAVREKLAKTVDVPAIDFARYIRELKENDPESKVFVKMDIEGAEYQVLRHLLKESVTQMIDELFVETHERFVEGEDEQSTLKLLSDISSLGTSVYKWK